MGGLFIATDLKFLGRSWPFFVLWTLIFHINGNFICNDAVELFGPEKLGKVIVFFSDSPKRWFQNVVHTQTHNLGRDDAARTEWLMTTIMRSKCGGNGLGGPLTNQQRRPAT